MSTYYPQEPGKNPNNQSGQPPVDPYGVNPSVPPSQPYGPTPQPQPYGPPAQPYRPPSQPQPHEPPSQPQQPSAPPYGPPAQPYGPPSQPYGPGQQGQATPIPPPQYQQYPAAGQQQPYQSYQSYPPNPASYGPPPQMPPARSNARPLIITLVVLVIIASIGAIVVPYAKTQIDHGNATATASTHATTVAHNATSTVVTQNAHATGTAQAIVAATAAVVKANPNPYPPQTGTLVELAKMPKVGTGTICNLTNGSIHATDSHAGSVGYCWGGNSYDNFAYDVEMTIVKGDCGGIIFREDGTEGSKEYMFNVCQYGYHTVDIDQGAMLQFKNITYAQTTPGLKQGLNQMNLIGVVAQGQNITVYVNKQQVASFTDSTYGSGLVGVDVWNTNSSGTDVSFANQRVWKL